MSGNYGTSELPLDKLTADKVVLTPLTSDPDDLEEGDWWYRSDLDSGDKIGTCRFYDGSSKWDIPVFPEGTSGDGVEEVRPVETPNGVGYVPVAAQANAAYPKIGFQHGGSRLAVHDAAKAIPEGVVLQYGADNWAQGDSTWPDEAGAAQDMAITGAPQATTLSDGADALAFDGTDDYGATTMPAALEGSGLTEWAVEMAFATTTTSTSSLRFFGVNQSTQLLVLTINLDEAFNSDAGNFVLQFRDSNGNALRFAIDGTASLNDGNRHNLSISINDTAANDVTVILDGTEQTLSFGASEGPSSFVAWNYDMAFAAQNNSGSLQNYMPIDYGAIRWHETSISSQTIGDYPGGGGF